MSSKEDGNDTSGARKRKQPPKKGTQEYILKRERNNESVKKCRKKTKIKNMERDKFLQRLRQENAELEQIF